MSKAMADESGLQRAERRNISMIAYIKGKLEEVRPTAVVVETVGTGYEINVPGSMADELQGHLHEEVKIHTYLQVREDGVALFGFTTRDALEVFKLLITVSGIGPKGALGILSAMSTDDAVLAGDTKAISKCPGIGAKTAGKLILELKDKFKLEDAFEEKWEKSAQSTGGHGADESVRKDAIEALAALGYAPSDAVKAVRAVTITEGMTTEDVLKLSLKQML